MLCISQPYVVAGSFLRGTTIWPKDKLVPIHKWPFSPISMLGGNFNPRNITHMPAVKISARLKLDENISFLDGH
jgi:hypothetical protein